MVIQDLLHLCVLQYEKFEMYWVLFFVRSVHIFVIFEMKIKQLFRSRRIKN